MIKKIQEEKKIDDERRNKLRNEQTYEISKEKTNIGKMKNMKKTEPEENGMKNVKQIEFKKSITSEKQREKLRED